MKENMYRVTFWLAVPFCLLAYLILFIAYQIEDCGTDDFKEYLKEIVQ